MCGILAYYSKHYLNSNEISESIKSLNSVKHRGPDGEGIVLINTVTGNYKILKTKDSRNDIIFHAGTKILGNKIFSFGGRVLNFTTLGNNYLKIRKRIIYLINKLNWKYGYFRKDIGWKIIEKR